MQCYFCEPCLTAKIFCYIGSDKKVWPGINNDFSIRLYQENDRVHTKNQYRKVYQGKRWLKCLLTTVASELQSKNIPKTRNDQQYYICCSNARFWTSFLRLMTNVAHESGFTSLKCKHQKNLFKALSVS